MVGLLFVFRNSFDNEFISLLILSTLKAFQIIIGQIVLIRLSFESNFIFDGFDKRLLRRIQVVLNVFFVFNQLVYVLLDLSHFLVQVIFTAGVFLIERSLR
jgi:hypothetical protein